MGQIQRMPEALANLIAAGEVVERPASCVKELVENSLDAGAKSIRVSLVDGGITAIVVQDDGCGMDAEDAVLAFARHATSKVKSARDLFHITTLGFRGEALASIAAVSHVVLQTRQPHAESGVEVRVAGGRPEAPRAVGMPPGTRIEVRSLFYNTPARLKYLRSVAAEQARCVEVVQRAALSRPDVAFVCETNGHVLFQTSGRGDLREVISVLFGLAEARQMIEVQAETADYRLTGWIGRPQQARSNRGHAFWAINRRPVRSLLLHQAVADAYAGRLMVHRHPVYALTLEMDPGLVDVNIHPHKTEVRLSEERDVCIFVQRAVREALEQALLMPSVPTFRGDASVHQRLPGPPSGHTDALGGMRLASAAGATSPSTREAAGQSGQEADQIGQGQLRLSLEPAPPGRRGVQVAEGRVRYNSPRARGGPHAVAKAAGIDLYRPPEQEDAKAAADRVDSQHTPAEAAADGPGPTAPVEADGARRPVTEVPEAESGPRRLTLRPIGQALGMYIIADDGEHLYIIDQHAAHERVLFERFSSRLAQGQVHAMPLLTPVQLRLTPGQCALAQTHAQVLREFGIVLEAFGGTDMVLREVPDIWEGLDYVSLAEHVIDALAHAGPGADVRAVLREQLAMRACKAAVKANQSLSPMEMEALCQALAEAQDPFHCPHGRPVILQMTNRDLEKAFRRIV